ncbi:hypothetical protein ACQJBY_071189 [Aegilops geniculata]
MPQNFEKEDGGEMDVDAAAPAAQVSIKHGLPEIEIYCYLLVLIFLIDHKKYDEAKACANASISSTPHHRSSRSSPVSTHRPLPSPLFAPISMAPPTSAGRQP